jgi:RNA polymerase sigma-70 factor (ECF subfamily)
MSRPQPKSLAGITSADQAERIGLVQRAKTRDRTAFERLYELYKQPVWNCLFYLIREREATYDLFQETFIRAWNNLPSLKENAQFEPWLHRIAANIAVDYLRHEKKLLFLPFSKDDEEAETTSVLPHTLGPEEHIGEKECIEQAFQCLSPRHRTCLLLHDQWGFSQREIASLLHISEKSVSAYMVRGREQFRQLYLRLIGEGSISEGKESIL